jgi:uncharacterized membrane protein YoaK (UPF0700 family)
MATIGDREDSSSRPNPPQSARERPLVVALVVLTFTTGLIDAVSYIGLGRVFVANMTGNVVLLGFAVTGVPGLSAIRSLLSLIGFLVGAAAGGRLETVLGGRNRRKWLLSVSVVETVLILAAAVASSEYNIDTGTPLARVYAMIVLTGIAMGLRNATVRSLKVPDLTTTVLTLTLTGLAADSLFGGGSSPRTLRRFVSVLVLFSGAATGAFLLRYGLALPLAVTAACVLGTSAAYALAR